MTATESKEEERDRMKEVIRRLREEYPRPGTSLRYESGHQLLVATILSAQTTDEQVNRVTPALFKKYPTVESFAGADEGELAQAIRSCGYYNQKARAIKGSSLAILQDHGGRVPDAMEQLLELPGVGRKTANCVLGTVYGIPSVVVDTHMIRIMNLLEFTDSRDPEKIEQDIMDLAPEKEWIDLAHLVIGHGRKVCIARRPRCEACTLNDLCPSSLV